MKPNDAPESFAWGKAFSKTCLVLSVLAFLVVGAPVRAQFITWNSIGTISGDSDVLTNGAYLDAIKSSTVLATADDVVNGVTFHLINTSGAETDGPDYIALSNVSTGGGDGGFAGGSAAYQNLMRGVSYVARNATGTITLSGLTVGHQYQVQVWNASATSENDLAQLQGTTNTLLNGHNFAVGTFTATSLSDSFNFTVPSSGNVTGYAGITAISLRDLTAVPEPSTYAMLAAGAVALFGLARLRRADRQA